MPSSPVGSGQGAGEGCGKNVWVLFWPTAQPKPRGLASLPAYALPVVPPVNRVGMDCIVAGAWGILDRRGPDKEPSAEASFDRASWRVLGRTSPARFGERTGSRICLAGVIDKWY